MKHGDREILVPAIIGPTGVGKTAVAVALAEGGKWEIVSADSRQIYRGLDIGTAKPSREERERAPHHLIDVAEPWEVYSCGRYRREASAAMENILSRGGVPLVVGGSGLYLRALDKGLFEGPERNEHFRGELRFVVEREGREALHHRLARVDPASASRIHPRDTERVIRALEVFEATGKPISELQRSSTESGRFRLCCVGLRRPREELYEAINRRFDAMLEAGLVAEVRSLVSRGFSEEWPAFRTVGYRELIRYLRGESSYEDACEGAKRESRRFAKRQATWFGKAPVEIWLEPGDGETLESVGARVVDAVKRAGAFC